MLVTQHLKRHSTKKFYLAGSTDLHAGMYLAVSLLTKQAHLCSQHYAYARWELPTTF